MADRGSRVYRGYPRLDCADWLASVSDAYLATVILRGGEPFGLETVMKPFEEELSPQQVADAVAFVRGEHRR